MIIFIWGTRCSIITGKSLLVGRDEGDWDLFFHESDSDVVWLINT